MLSVGVAIEKASFAYDNIYTYLVPDALKDEITVGSRVIVPFGNGNKRRLAVVLEVGISEDTKLKSVYSALGKDISLSDEQVKLVYWLKENTFCTFFEAAKTMLPPGMNAKIRDDYRVEKTDYILTDEEAEFVKAVQSAKTKLEKSKLFCEDNRTMINRLSKLGVLVFDGEIKRNVLDDEVFALELSDDFEEKENSVKLTLKQTLVLETLKNVGTALLSEICEECSVTAVVVKNLEKTGLIRLFKRERERLDTEETKPQPEKIVLSKEQQKVLDGINALRVENKPAVALLYGVTGSGKTLIYLKLIDDILKSGKNAIMLVPEISLTPQTLKRFRKHFGNEVAITHSGLSMGERTREYKRIKSGKVRIVIGTRSAVFAPLQNIGAIIIDEEGESTYRSESSPRFDARKVAKTRIMYHNAVLLLSSATPSIESYYMAERGKYHLFELNERYSKSVLPEVYIVDMKDELSVGNHTQISKVLADELKKNLECGEQSILLLNRRGYNTYVSCLTCREPVVCPNCNIALTYHKSGERVVCHYCGYSKPIPKVCPKCGSEYMKFTGAGTQKAEDEVRAVCPTARILRMDADTTCSRYSYEKNFTDFADGKYDIMLGTQMIAKGLDFPNVTLVGVLTVDKALYAGDFKSYERTFSLITQVVGRGGRGDKAARAYIQTFSPDHYVLNLAALQDYKGFYKDETAVRKALTYPPYCDLCVVGFSGSNEAETKNASEIFVRHFAKIIKEIGSIPVNILGPSRADLGKINNKYRYRAVIKCKNNKAFRAVVARVMKETATKSEFKNVSVYADLNGEIGL